MFGTPTHTDANLGIIEVHHTAHVNHSVTDRYTTRSPVEAHLTRAHIAHDKPYAYAPHAPHAHDYGTSGVHPGRGRVPPTKKIRPLVVLVLAVNASQDFLKKA